MISAGLRTFLIGTVLCVATAAPAFAQDGRYIVKFRDGRSAQGQAAVRAGGGQILLTLGPQDAVAARIPAAAVQGLSRNPNVEYIEDDVIREPFAQAGATAGVETVPYGIKMVQADLIAIAPAAAVNRKVCIIDSGYSDQHEDLAMSTSVTAKTTDTGSGTWNKDSCGHGTHVAGTVAAMAGNSLGVVGANPGVSLHIVKVFGDDNLVESGNCGWTYSSNLVNALNACVAAGSNVVSMSLGGALKNRTEENAFTSANSNGVLNIAAAGNAGNTTTSYPAGYKSVVSVAAVDSAEVAGTFSQRNRDVEIAAPGVAVLSTVPFLDENTLTSGTTWIGGRLDGAARTTGTPGTLIDGGLCTAAGSWAGYTVLCQRGSISFADKVKNVEAGGGKAAVVYNNVASDASCGVYSGTLGDAPTTTIPAITLSCADGSAAVGQAGAGSTVKSAVATPSSGYEAWDGTSMATPHVSAVAALVWACHPTLTNQQVRDALNATAKDKGAAGRDTTYGFGIVQAKAALLSINATNLGNCSLK